MKLSTAGGETELELQNLKVTKFKPHAGFTGWFKNWGIEESWTPAHLQQLTGTPSYSYSTHEKYLRVAKAGVGLMPLSQARTDIYTPAIRQAISDRADARGVAAPYSNDVKSFSTIQTNHGNLPEAPKKLLALLVEAEAQAGVHANDVFATDDKLNEFMKAVEECKDFGLKWNMTDKSDYTAERNANPEKINSLVEYLKDFADYCQIQADLTKVADLKTLKKESETLKNTHEKLSTLEDDKDEALTVLSNELDKIEDIKNKNQLVVEDEDDDDEDVTLQDKLVAQQEGMRKLNQLETEYKPYFEVQALLDKHEAAEAAFNTALAKLCPNHATDNYAGLVRAKELNEAINDMADIDIDAASFAVKQREIAALRKTIGDNIVELQEAIAAPQA
jgi:hypothetical protein